MAPARPVRGLSCEDTFVEAAGKIIWTRFDEMMSYRDAALKGKSPDGVHDMRVASRRLRAALELFRDVFPRREFKTMLSEVKGLADALGGVRDLDVMLQRLEEDMAGRPGPQRLALKSLIDDLGASRLEARRALKQSISGLEDSDFARQFLSMVARETT